MIKILTALLIGVVAGLIDTLPMLSNKNIPRFSIYHLFAQWVFIGLITPFIAWELQAWLKGLIIAELGMIPILIISYHRNRKAVPKIIIFAAALGIGIGLASQYFIS